MADEFGKLFKYVVSDSAIKPAGSVKKLNESKRILNDICRSLLTNTSYYDPVSTVEIVNTYVQTTDKMDRILYSEISGLIFDLNEKDRGIFSTNVDKLLQYVLDDTNVVSEDSRKICIKFYDHFQLILIQIENVSKITKNGIADAMKYVIEDSHKEIKGIQKEYITILGIFAAIMLAFVGSFTFSTSVLNNVGKDSGFELIAVAIIIGLVFAILINLLLDFLREINDKEIRDTNGANSKKKWSNSLKTGIALLVMLCFISVISYGISKMNFPENISLFGHQYRIVEESENQEECEIEKESGISDSSK